MKKVMLLVTMAGVMISCGNPSPDDDNTRKDENTNVPDDEHEDDEDNNNSHKNGEVYNPDGIEMVYVEGNDTVKGFYIGKYEVTQTQYQDVMGAGVNPSNSKGSDRPVENVSWDDAQEFIEKLNASTGKCYRLPTETEWKYAARGGIQKSVYEYSGSNDIDAVAWYSDSSGSETHLVGQKKANALGIYDMTGNVWEWCDDCYDNSCSYRVIRGGGWYQDAQYCRIAYKGYSIPDNHADDIGFRLVLSSCGSSSSSPSTDDDHDDIDNRKNGEVYNPDGIEMVYVGKISSSGTLTGEICGFHIGKYEVTQEQYQAIMSTNRSYFSGDNLPVEHVSWNDVREFIKKLNVSTGRSYRLPTEAEWEYAARGGTKKSDYEYSGGDDIDAVAWYKSNSDGQTHTVGQKKANALGIYDMSGNVWEWCQNCYDSSCSSRVNRGGSWHYDAENCRVARRMSITNDPDYSWSDVGFRLVLP
ncbi:MAG: SUMF1/EgtB/PvdO family nonheme iron enzyme [Prevotellaceae bacterium]|jgi:formylglycine-generating enzyme required for sulfatase activity|nr:SUMF1/EgtB/PvdO family nonheme iron enzyme [Prevotellaceae bacterium]